MIKLKCILSSSLCLFIISLLFLKIACSNETKKRSGISIKGEIVNFDDYNLENSFIQLVAINIKNNEVKGATATYDIDNNMVGAEYSSEFPKLKKLDSGKFTYRIEKLKPSHYFLAIQDLMPKNKPIGYFGPGPYLSRPIAKEKNKPIIIQISKKGNPSFNIDLGKVFIAFKEDNRFILIKFKEVFYIKP